MATFSESYASGHDANAVMQDRSLEQDTDAFTAKAGSWPRNRGLDGNGTVDSLSSGLADVARLILDARRKRSEIFPDIEFDDAAWTMTLDLYDKHVTGRHATIMSLCAISGAPQTSALRSINAMVGLGHFVRRKDPADARRVFIHPSAGLVDRVERYLSEFGCRIETLANAASASDHVAPEERTGGDRMIHDKNGGTS